MLGRHDYLPMTPSHSEMTRDPTRFEYAHRSCEEKKLLDFPRLTVFPPIAKRLPGLIRLSNTPIRLCAWRLFPSIHRRKKGWFSRHK